MRRSILTQSDVVKIANLIRAPYGPTTVELTCLNNGLDFRPLGEALKQEGILLQELSMKNAQLDDAGIGVVAEALQVNTTLKKMDLSENKINDEKMTILAVALRVNRALEVLDLRYNRISNAGAVALAQALTVNKTLRRLYLTSNWIGEEGAAAFEEALSTNRTLIELELTGLSPLASQYLVRNQQFMRPLELTSLVRIPARASLFCLGGSCAASDAMPPSWGPSREARDEKYEKLRRKR